MIISRARSRRLLVEELPDGSRLVTLSCPCYRVAWRLTGWESVDMAAQALREAHGRAVPSCPHRDGRR